MFWSRAILPVGVLLCLGENAKIVLVSTIEGEAVRRRYAALTAPHNRCGPFSRQTSGLSLNRIWQAIRIFSDSALSGTWGMAASPAERGRSDLLPWVEVLDFRGGCEGD